MRDVAPRYPEGALRQRQSGQVEVAFTITPDGGVLFTRTAARAFVADLYEIPAGEVEPRKLLDAGTLLGAGGEHLSVAEKARRERKRRATRGISG